MIQPAIRKSCRHMKHSKKSSGQTEEQLFKDLVLGYDAKEDDTRWSLLLKELGCTLPDLGVVRPDRMLSLSVVIPNDHCSSWKDNEEVRRVYPDLNLENTTKQNLEYLRFIDCAAHYTYVIQHGSSQEVHSPPQYRA